MKKAGRLLLLFMSVAIVTVLALPSLRQGFITTPLAVLRAEWQLSHAKTAADEKAAIETATKVVRIWSVGPATETEVADFVANKIPKVVVIQWAETNPLSGEPYRTTHRLISEANWQVLLNGYLSR